MESLTDVTVKLTEEDGNAFAVLAKVKKALEEAGHADLAKQYLEQATRGNYDHLLQTTMKFVRVE